MARGATLGGVLQQSRVACMARLPSATSHRLQLFPPTNILTRCKMVEEGRLFRKRQRTLSGHRQTLCQLTSGSATCALEPPRSARRFQWGTAPAPIACSLRFFQYTRECLRRLFGPHYGPANIRSGASRLPTGFQARLRCRCSSAPRRSGTRCAVSQRCSFG